MAESYDYSKLRSPSPTPDDEICMCTGQPPIKLMHALGYNPLHCLECNLEVRPESLHIPAMLVEDIASWRALYGAIDHLWLDSGAYEDWAARELRNIESPVNKQGREVQRLLNPIRRCYYWYFQELIDRLHPPIGHCPVCSKELVVRTSRLGPVRVCEPCSIVAQGG